MSDEFFSVVAVASALASVAALWSSFRRRQLMRRFLRSLDKAQLRELLEAEEPPNTVSSSPPEKQG